MNRKIMTFVLGMVMILNIYGVLAVDLFQNWTMSTDDGGITTVKLIGGMCNSVACDSINESYVSFYREEAWNCVMSYWNNTTALENCLSPYLITSPVDVRSKIIVRYKNVPTTASTHYEVYFFGKDYINYVWDGIPYCNANAAACIDNTERSAELKKKENATAEITGVYVRNMNDVTKPIMINIDTGIGASVCSAFRRVNITNYWPAEDGEYIDYSVDTKVNVEIKDERDIIVYRNTSFQRIPADVCYDNFTFVWVPGRTGRYYLRVWTEINDTQIRNPGIDESNKTFYVYDSRTSYCYSRIANLSVTNEIEDPIIREGEKTRIRYEFYTAIYIDDRTIEAVPAELVTTIIRKNDSRVLTNFSTIYSSVANGTYQSYDTLLGPYEKGEYKVIVRAVAKDSRCDSLVNQYEEDSKDFYVVSSSFDNDFEPPTTYVSITPNTTVNGWYTSNLTITLTCTDNEGCYRTYYCLDHTNTCSPGTIYTGSISLTQGGVWYLRYYSVDLKGNREGMKNITIRLDNRAPAVNVITPTYFNEGSEGYIFVNATDLESGINKIEIYVDGNKTYEVNGTAVNYTFTVSRNFSYEVKVYDNVGHMWRTNRSVVINLRPIAVIQASPTSGTGSVTVTFNGSQSYDPEGDNITLSWDFENDGIVDATGSVVTHTYGAGTYTAVLRVVDSKGAVGVATVTISVTSTVSSGGSTRYVGGSSGGTSYVLFRNEEEKKSVVKNVKIEPVINIPYLVEIEAEPNSTVYVYIDGNTYKTIKVGSNGKVAFDLVGLTPGRHVLEIKVGNETVAVRGFVVFGIPSWVYIPSFLKLEANKTATVRFRIDSPGKYKIITRGPNGFNVEKTVEIKTGKETVEINFSTEKEGEYEVEWMFYKDLKLYADFNTTIKVVKTEVQTSEKEEEQKKEEKVTGLIVGRTLKSTWFVVTVIVLIILTISGVVIYKKRDHPRIKAIIEKIKSKLKREKKLDEFVEEEF